VTPPGTHRPVGYSGDPTRFYCPMDGQAWPCLTEVMRHKQEARVARERAANAALPPVVRQVVRLWRHLND
jgi:hypothetical protein